MDPWEFVWDAIKHDDTLFTNRSSFFLVGHTMLFGALAVALTGNWALPDEVHPVFVVTLAAIGNAFSIAWVWTSARHIVHRDWLYAILNGKRKADRRKWITSTGTAAVVPKPASSAVSGGVFGSRPEYASILAGSELRSPGAHAVMGIWLPSTLCLIWSLGSVSLIGSWYPPGERPSANVAAARVIKQDPCHPCARARLREDASPPGACD